MDAIIEMLTKAKQEDFERVRDLLQELYPDREALTFERFSYIAEGDQADLFVARHGGVVVGTATLAHYKKLMGDVHVIEDVIVNKELRSRGFGRKLTKTMLEHARCCLGADFVDVNSRHPDAIGFYESLGFKHKGQDGPFFSLRKYLS